MSKACLFVQSSLLVAAVLCSQGCGFGNRTQEEIGNSIDSWSQARAQYAAALDAQIGGKGYHVVPVRGALYPIGTVFNQDSPSPYTAACQFPPDAISDDGFSSLPAITVQRGFNFDVGAPTKWLSAIKVAEASADVTTSQSFQMAYSQLRHRSVYTSPMMKHIATETCLGEITDLAQNPKTIIRGYITGKLTLRSSSQFKAGATVKVVEADGLVIKYDDSGGYSIEDEAPVEQFVILAHVTADKEKISDDEKMEQLMEQAASEGGTPEQQRERLLKYLEDNGFGYFSIEEKAAGEPSEPQPDDYVYRVDVTEPPAAVVRQIGEVQE